MLSSRSRVSQSLASNLLLVWLDYRGLLPLDKGSASGESSRWVITLAILGGRVGFPDGLPYVDSSFEFSVRECDVSITSRQ